MSYLFTSESVTEGHPDKVADQISDAILDSILSDDPNARVAAETLLAKGTVIVAGEVTTETYVNIEEIVRNTVVEIGYDRAKYGLDGHSVGVQNSITAQSPEIAGGVFNALEGRTEAGEEDTRSDEERQGAGDQGIIFGYAVKDNSSYHPVAGKLAHLLSAKLTNIRKNGEGKGLLLPDGKTQVTIEYDEYNNPTAIDNILISTQHVQGSQLKTVQDFVIRNVIKPVITEYNEEHGFYTLEDKENYLVNPAGAWHIGGSSSDSGLTGRKIVADSYQGYARHGGGAYSGKDPSKVDRSAAYYLRYIAKNLVAAGLADELELQIAYAIGKAEPLSVFADTKGKHSVGKNVIEGIVKELFDFRPGYYIKHLQLKEFTNYKETAKNGHFGRNPELFPWEKLDKVQEIQNFI